MAIERVRRIGMQEAGAAKLGGRGSFEEEETQMRRLLCFPREPQRTVTIITKTGPSGKSQLLKPFSQNLLPRPPQMPLQPPSHHHHRPHCPETHSIWLKSPLSLHWPVSTLGDTWPYQQTKVFCVGVLIEWRSPQNKEFNPSEPTSMYLFSINQTLPCNASAFRVCKRL